MAKNAKTAAEDVSKNIESSAKEMGDKAQPAAEDASRAVKDTAR